MVLCRADTSSERPAELRMTSTINRALSILRYEEYCTAAELWNTTTQQYQNDRYLCTLD